MHLPLIIERARKNSVAVQHFQITKEQGEEVRRVERAQGRSGVGAGLKYH
jgi:hypothetical protein